MDTPVVGVLVYTMDISRVGPLVYTHGHSNGGDPGLLPWTLQWWGTWFTPMDTPVMGPWFTSVYTPMMGVLVYTIDTPMVGALVYTHGHSSGRGPSLHPQTLQWWGQVGAQVPGPSQTN